MSLRLRNGRLIRGFFAAPNDRFCLLQDGRRIAWKHIRSFKVMR